MFNHSIHTIALILSVKLAAGIMHMHHACALLPLFIGIAAADGPCDIFVRTGVG